MSPAPVRFDLGTVVYEVELLGAVSGEPNRFLIRIGQRAFYVGDQVYGEAAAYRASAASPISGPDSQQSEAAGEAFRLFLDSVYRTSHKRSPHLRFDVTAAAKPFVHIAASLIRHSTTARVAGLLLLSFNVAGAIALVMAHGWPDVRALAEAMPVVVAFACLHELGHVIAARASGVDSRFVGIELRGMLPSLFAEVGEVARLPVRNRVAVSVGGLYAQMLAGAVLILASAAVPGDRTWLAAGAACNVGLVAANALPFFGRDGYWVLADMSGRPQLAADARTAFFAKDRSAEPQWLVWLHRSAIVLSVIGSAGTLVLAGELLLSMVRGRGGLIAAAGMRPFGIVALTIVVLQAGAALYARTWRGRTPR